MTFHRKSRLARQSQRRAHTTKAAADNDDLMGCGRGLSAHVGLS